MAADVVPLPADAAEAEALKQILYHLKGNLRLPWTKLRCSNKLPQALAATEIYSCAYDVEVNKC